MNDWIIAVVAIIFGCLLSIVVISKVAGLIKAWINRNKNTYDEEKFERLAKAFIQQKKRTERRLEKLEAGEEEQKSERALSERMGKEAQLDHELQIDSEEEQPQPKTTGGNLNNMLRQQEKSH